MPERGEQDQVLEYREQWSRLLNIETAQLYVGTRRVHEADARAVSEKQICVIAGGCWTLRSDELRSSLSPAEEGRPVTSGVRDVTGDASSTGCRAR